MGATVQGLLQGFWSGLGAGIGAIIGGVMYKYLGGITLYRIMACWCALGALFFFISNKLLEKFAPLPAKYGNPELEILEDSEDITLLEEIEEVKPPDLVTN